MTNPTPRPWGGHVFDFVSELRPAAGPKGEPLEFMPQARYAKAASAQLHRYGGGPFCKFQIPWVAAREGVYIIASGDDALYIGECLHLSQRFNMGYGSIQPRNCYTGGQQTNCRINTLVLVSSKDGKIPGLWFKASEVRKNLERELVDRLRPPWNR